jgi:hypothetical protein
MKGWVKSVQTDSANTVHWQTILVITQLLLFCLWVLILKVGDYSLWWVVMKITPGANALQLFVAFCNFLVFPVSICCWAESSPEPTNNETALQFIVLMSIAVIGLFIIV